MLKRLPLEFGASGGVAAKLDPTIGILHGNTRGQQGLVYDLMEPARPIVDRKVLEFAQSRTFHPADFTIRADGVCRLNPELARHVVRTVTIDQNYGMIDKAKVVARG